MADPDEDHALYWYEPEWRGIIPLDAFHVPKNLARLYRQGKFELRMNTAFRDVMKGCAERDETWISEEIVEVYCELHKRGHAYSFESWQQGKLVGGLYGVAMGKAFFGESMFSRATDASKVALVFLVNTLKANNYTLLDTQYLNDHLKQFGAIEIPREAYLDLLYQAIYP